MTKPADNSVTVEFTRVKPNEIELIVIVIHTMLMILLVMYIFQLIVPEINRNS